FKLRRSATRAYSDFILPFSAICRESSEARLLDFDFAVRHKGSMEPSSPIPPPLLPSQPSRGNWWQRNWKWFVPTGCLTLIALAVAFVAMIVVVVFGAMKSSDAYKIAVTRAKNDERVVRAIGKPISEGMFVSGNMNVNGGSR